MSFILDALKRADAERERGRVPGLHSQTPLPTATAAVRPARPSRWGWLVGLLVLLVATLAWWLWPSRRDTATIPAPPVASAPAPAPAAEPTPPTTAVAPASAEVAPVAAPAPAPAPLPPVAPLLGPPPALPAQAAPAAGKSVPAPAPAIPAAPPPKPAAPGPVRRLADLPADQRAQLPRLAVSGASYSQNPAHRMLIVNGAVVQEGQEIAPGLRLERIGPNEAVIDHRGLRFSITY